MKIKLTIVIFVLLQFIFEINLNTTPSNQEKLIEKVTVTNIEVPVRVFYKGKPVSNLSIKDFEIYENNKKMEINGFFIKKKKIIVSEEKKEISYIKTESPPRTFVLVFNITDFNKYIIEAVDFVFNQIIRKNDRLLIFINNKTINCPRVENSDKIKSELFESLKEESTKARNTLIKYIQKVEQYLKVHDFRTQIHRRDFRAVRLINYLKKYKQTWNDYKIKYLTPRIDRFYYFSKYLEKVKTEKWVLNFYQLELFPRIRLGSDAMERLRQIAILLINTGQATNMARGKLIISMLNQLYIEFNINNHFPTEEVSKLFYKVNATFHSFFIKTVNKAYSNEFEFEEIASALEHTLKSITQKTGGKNITSNNLVKSLKTVSEIEDIYYLITYAPDNPHNKTGKIKVILKNKKYQVFYDDNMRADYISDYLKKLEKQTQTPDIKLTDFSFQQKILTFFITNYLMQEKNQKKTGSVKVRIRFIDDRQHTFFDQQKILIAKKNETKISLGPLREFKNGDYGISIDVKDLYSGKETSLMRYITIN